jgi:hypothetical protein
MLTHIVSIACCDSAHDNYCDDLRQHQGDESDSYVNWSIASDRLEVEWDVERELVYILAASVYVRVSLTK